MNDMTNSLTLMVVEDDTAIRNVIETMAELWEFDVLLFKDGFEATNYLNGNDTGIPRPDAALLDIRMPGPQGPEISAKIRSHPQLSNIAIMLMTAYELHSADEEKILAESGADRLLYKPLPPMDELINQLNEIIASRQS